MSNCQPSESYSCPGEKYSPAVLTSGFPYPVKGDQNQPNRLDVLPEVDPSIVRPACRALDKTAIFAARDSTCHQIDDLLMNIRRKVAPFIKHLSDQPLCPSVSYAAVASMTN